MISDMVPALQFLFLVSLTNGYSPPAVEVPPIDVYQRTQPGRDYANGNGRQVAYSYGTTVYHHQQQQPSAGFASARLTSDQSGGRSHVAPDQRPECQNPMLRVFFKTCHPPGTAPQSPVQCQPIPGQTNFRCMIKQQFWPVVRISECPPGTASSGGDCIRVPGSFGTNGVMIVPVASSIPGQRIVHQSGSVYRHCANGACQTCIGDQCSTTGILTPMSVDQRGRHNSSTEVVAFGDAGRDVRQKCANHICKTCIDRICYDRSYPLLRVTAGCPAAVCEDNCTDFVYWTDQCPICRCRGFASREPCRTQSECPAGSTCRNYVCIYAGLPNTHFDKVCTFSSQCPSDQLCYNWRCGAKTALSRHLDQSCAVDHDCPANHFCADMTCWEGDPSRLRGQDCILDHQCPTGYYCTNGKCTDVYHHGSFGSYSPSTPTVPPTTDSQCNYDQQCYGGEKCFERRCLTYDEYGRIDDARRQQQVQHQSWRPQQVHYPASATKSSVQDNLRQASADEEYQKRIAEYNRQRTQQERQQEEQRRQLEAESRRQQQEADAQRQRQLEADRRNEAAGDAQRRQLEEDEAERRRLEQDAGQRRQEQAEERRRQSGDTQHQLQEVEDQRRRQEQDEQRRRQEQEDQRRRQWQEEETQRLIREQEEARRRTEAENQARIREQTEQEQRRRQKLETSDQGRYRPRPTPDVEVGEEASEDSVHDDEQEYERRTEEYNRQLKERQRQLHAEQEEESDRSTNPRTTENPLMQFGQVEVHDDEDDFYGRSRQRTRPMEGQDQSVSSYRVRYQRFRSRQ